MSGVSPPGTTARQAHRVAEFSAGPRRLDKVRQREKGTKYEGEEQVLHSDRGFAVRRVRAGGRRLQGHTRLPTCERTGASRPGTTGSAELTTNRRGSYRA